MAYKYPFGNTQQLNLDWLLRQWRVFQSQIEDMIAPAYSDTDIYPAYSLVIVQHKLYYNPQAIEAAEDWTPAHWEEITLAEIFEGNLQGG